MRTWTRASRRPTAFTHPTIPAQGDLTHRGAYRDAPSPYGTFDQGGNVSEWNETGVDQGSLRILRGGRFDAGVNRLFAGWRDGAVPGFEDAGVGFRLPEPGRDLMLVAGALALACLRGRRSR